MLHNEVLSETDALNDWWVHRTIPASREKKPRMVTQKRALITHTNDYSRLFKCNSKISAHEGVAVSPLIQHNNTGAVAISATHEQLSLNIIQKESIVKGAQECLKL